MKKQMSSKSYETFHIYKDGEVVIESNIAGDRRVLNRRNFRDYILELPDGRYAFHGAPRYRHPGEVDFHFTVSHGNVEIDKTMWGTVAPSRTITTLRELAELMLEASEPEGLPYGRNGYSDGVHPNYWGQMCFL